MDRFAPYYLDHKLDGWVPLAATDVFDITFGIAISRTFSHCPSYPPHRIEIQLEDKTLWKGAISNTRYKFAQSEVGLDGVGSATCQSYICH